MQTRVKWLAGGVAAYLLFLLCTLPASLLLSRLAARGISASSASGSIWNGAAVGVRAGVLNLGAVQWQVRWLPLFTGRVAADVDARQGDGYAQGRFSISLGGRVRLDDLSASLPLHSLLGSGGLPGGWVGMAQARFEELTLVNNWPVTARGTLNIIDLTGPARAPSNIGAYRLSFAGDGSNEQMLIGALTDQQGAALSVTGQLTFRADRSYQLDTQLAAQPGAPASLAQMLEVLGAPDAQGRRPFSLSGTF